MASTLQAHPQSQLDLENATPSQLLHLAATLGRTDLVMSAISSGADVNAQVNFPADSTDTHTPLHAAVKNGHLDVTRALLADPSVDLLLKDSLGRTAFSYLPSQQENPDMHSVFMSDLCQKAARGDHVALKRAIAAGLDPAAVDSPDLNNTPLHWAASFGATECVKVLISAGVPLDPKNKAGNTPLLDAAVGGHSRVIRILIDAGADASIKNSHGLPASQLPKLAPEVLTELSKPPNVKSSKSSKKAAPSSSSTVKQRVNKIPSNDLPSDSSQLPINPQTPSFTPGQTRRASTTVPNLPKWATALWPPPRRFCEAGASFTVPPVLTVSAENTCLPVAKHLIEWLAECSPLHDTDTSIRLVGGGQGGLGEPIAFSASIFLRIDPYALEAPHEAYSICVRDFGIDVVASDLRGLFYASATLVNIFQLAIENSSDPDAPLTIPTLTISDWPMLRRRGMHLDLSRKRAPSLESLKRIIAFMARHLKMNQLHLHILDNFDRLKGQSISGMYRHEDILELDQWCSQYFVDLIPVIGQTGVKSTASPAAVNGGATQKVAASGEENEALFDEFLPLFNTDLVNLGNIDDDKTHAVPDFARMRDLSRSIRSRGKKNLLVYGNQFATILEDEKLAVSVLPELPARVIMILETKQNAQVNSIESACIKMRKHGLPFYTCTSSFLEGTITGKLSALLEQTEHTVNTAIDQGAVGAILKDTSLTQSYSPLIFLLQSMIPFGGACWNNTRGIHAKRSGSSSEMGMEVDGILSQLLDTYVFSDSADKAVLGGITVSLGDLNVVAGDESGLLLPRLLSYKDTDPLQVVDQLAYMGLRRAVKRADRMEGALTAYDGNAAPEIVAELRMSALLMGVASRMGAWMLSISSAVSMEGTVRDDIDGEFDLLESRGKNRATNSRAKGVEMTGKAVGLSSLPDGRRSDLCNTILQGVELLRESWMAGYHKVGFVEAVDDLVGNALKELAQDMPYQAYLEERRAEEWAPFEDN